MAGNDRADNKADEGVAADAKSACLKPACVALVPTVGPSPCSKPPTQLSRPDAGFVTHLIATAEHLPQTRVHRRATSADALTAYRARQRKALDAGLSTRQTA